MTTLATFRSNVAAIIGLDNTSAGDQGLIDGWINEGYANIVRETRCKVSPATITLTSGTKDYTLATAIMLIIDAFVTSSATDYKMKRIGLEQILEYRRNGATTTSDPPVYYALGGGNLFLVYPTPASADVVTIYYVPRPTALSVSSTEPEDIPAEFHHVVELYALSRAADYDDDTSSKQGERYLNEYRRGINSMRRDLALKGSHRLPRAVIPGANRKLLPHANDRDVY